MFDAINELLAGAMREPTPWAYLVAYLGGLLVSFTPCIYPVIPVTVGIVGTRGKGTLRGGFLHSVAYVSGISITYSLLGVTAAASGSLFGQWQMNPWIFLFMGNLCLIMGLAKLGVFNLSFSPSGRWAKVQGKGFIGTLFLGIASGLVIGPCTAPVLAVLLGYVAVSGQILYGASLLFVFAFGMGTILIIFGTFANLLARLPKSGNWLLTFDRIFGFILIGAGEYFLIMTGKLFY
ncbi:MAG: cytochrome c biogenesis protein CcdA [Desulfuromonadales bacterium]|nr:cytochrome c biogenesis protein CcdA [Desulfuromonadales bacterium]